MKILNSIENVLIGAGVMVALTDIQTIIGIVLMCFEVGLILFKIGYKIYQSIKKGDPNEVIQTIEDGKKEIEDMKNSQPKDK